ncbi:MAG: hypothetical protein GY851_01540 [bacterium]|nr:hypothetical protein [bacterium]
MLSRRRFLACAAAASGTAFLGDAHAADESSGAVRRYHVCLGSKYLETDPDLLDVVRDAGVTDVWQASFFYGHWYEKPDGLRRARERVESKGLRWHVINVPLGHPGDALGDTVGQTPITPPTRWRLAVRPDGSKYSGTSLHPPATAENVEAVRAIAALKSDCIFLDDDFRLATGPGVIGGCYCDWHRQRFLAKGGYTEARWGELLTDVRERRLSPILRAWVESTCDELTGCFRAQQAAAPDVAIGNMIMYLGAEKAGIRLADYVDAPFRVGEMMFHDAAFGPLKGKTDELFSALFHRRFAKPELAYSETTAFPADKLSARNMAAKLVVSTFTDVRNTMYMSGMTPFPKTHWDVLAPAMRKQTAHHERLVGHTPRGPLKHYWGEAQRYVGDDRPFSLFLAMGIPFEVTDRIANEGWTFLSDFDARSLGTNDKEAAQGRLVCRGGLGIEGARGVDESLEALWALKREFVETGLDVPFVEDETPVACAWYPSAKAVLLWNLSEERRTLRVRWQGKTMPAEAEGLDTALVNL